MNRITTLFGIKWLEIYEGEFHFGETDRSAINLHQARSKTYYLPSYWISETPVTNKQFSYYLEEKNTNDKPISYALGKGNHPITSLSIYDILQYTEWLSQQYSLKVTLPSELEWEKAASWDPEINMKYSYPWGNEFSKQHCNSKESTRNSTTHVKKFPQGKSYYGLYDMVGNVWEWTQSVYSENISSVQKKEGLTKADFKVLPFVLKGGSFQQGKDYQTCAYRLNSRIFPNSEHESIGFRLVIKPNTSISCLDHIFFTDLRKKMIYLLNRQELETICFNLGVDVEDLYSRTKSELVNSLISYCKRRGVVTRLIEECAIQNDNPKWRK